MQSAAQDTVTHCVRPLNSVLVPHIFVHIAMVSRPVAHSVMHVQTSLAKHAES